MPPKKSKAKGKKKAEPIKDNRGHRRSDSPTPSTSSSTSFQTSQEATNAHPRQPHPTPNAHRHRPPELTRSTATPPPRSSASDGELTPTTSNRRRNSLSESASTPTTTQSYGQAVVPQGRKREPSASGARQSFHEAQSDSEAYFPPDSSSGSSLSTLPLLSPSESDSTAFHTSIRSPSSSPSQSPIPLLGDEDARSSLLPDSNTRGFPQKPQRVAVGEKVPRLSRAEVAQLFRQNFALAPPDDDRISEALLPLNPEPQYKPPPERTRRRSIHSTSVDHSRSQFVPRARRRQSIAATSSPQVDKEVPDAAETNKILMFFFDGDRTAPIKNTVSTEIQTPSEKTAPTREKIKHLHNNTSEKWDEPAWDHSRVPFRSLADLDERALTPPTPTDETNAAFQNFHKLQPNNSAKELFSWLCSKLLRLKPIAYWETVAPDFHIIQVSPSVSQIGVTMVDYHIVDSRNLILIETWFSLRMAILAHQDFKLKRLGADHYWTYSGACHHKYQTFAFNAVYEASGFRHMFCFNIAPSYNAARAFFLNLYQQVVQGFGVSSSLRRQVTAGRLLGSPASATIISGSNKPQFEIYIREADKQVFDRTKVALTEIARRGSRTIAKSTLGLDLTPTQLGNEVRRRLWWEDRRIVSMELASPLDVVFHVSHDEPILPAPTSSTAGDSESDDDDDDDDVHIVMSIPKVFRQRKSAAMWQAYRRRRVTAREEQWKG